MCFSLSLLFGLFSSCWIVKDVSTDLTKSTLCCCTSALKKRYLLWKLHASTLCCFCVDWNVQTARANVLIHQVLWQAHGNTTVNQSLRSWPDTRWTLCSYYLFIVIFSPDKKKRRRNVPEALRDKFFSQIIIFSVIYFGFSEINSGNHKYSVKNRHNPI